MLFPRARIIFPATLVLILIGSVLVLDGLAIGGTHEADEPASMPERIAGYEVLYVNTKDNTVCYSKDVPLFILQSTEETLDDLWSSDTFDMGAIRQDLRDKGFPEETEVGIDGPGSSKEMALQVRARWNKVREANGCIRFGGSQDETADSESALDGVSQ